MTCQSVLCWDRKVEAWNSPGIRRSRDVMTGRESNVRAAKQHFFGPFAMSCADLNISPAVREFDDLVQSASEGC